jgi:hypothetical protein
MPAFSPAAGTYTSAQYVTISGSTRKSKIYFTTDGTAPTTSSTVYTGSLTVGATETLRAIAVATGYAQSPVASTTYAINLPAVPAPTFVPLPGTFSSSQTVMLQDAARGATIHYTLDGSAPTANSPTYTRSLIVSSSETIQAVAFGKGYSPGPVASGTYMIKLLPAAVPTYSPAGGSYVGSQYVTISDSTARAKIYYTTDGSTPTVNSKVYTGSFKVSASELVNAIAVANGYVASGVGTANYTISSAHPSKSQ